MSTINNVGGELSSLFKRFSDHKNGLLELKRHMVARFDVMRAAEEAALAECLSRIDAEIGEVDAIIGTPIE